MPNAPVAAAATGLPAACLPLATVHDCGLVYEALQSALDTVTGAMLQPRCKEGCGAYSHLEALSEWLMAEAERVVARASDMAPKTTADADERARLLLQHEINCGAGPAGIAALAASLADDRLRIPAAQH